MLSNLNLTDLHDIGGWCFAALFCAAMVYAFIKGLIVARAIYDEQAARADQMAEDARASTKAVAQMTGVMSKLLDRQGIPK